MRLLNTRAPAIVLALICSGCNSDSGGLDNYTFGKGVLIGSVKYADGKPFSRATITTTAAASGVANQCSGPEASGIFTAETDSLGVFVLDLTFPPVVNVGGCVSIRVKPAISSSRSDSVVSGIAIRVQMPGAIRDTSKIVVVFPQ